MITLSPYNLYPQVVTDGLVLYLDAANPLSYSGIGTTWKNLSGSNDATLVGGVSYVANPIQTFSFINNYAIFQRPSALVTGGQISICLWVKWTTSSTLSPNSIQVLIDNRHFNNPQRGFVIQDRPDLNRRLTFSCSPSNNGAITSFIVGDNTWRFIVATNDGSLSKLFIDGNFNAQLSEAGLATVQPDVTIGMWQTDLPTKRFLNGQIPFVAMYNRALNSEEVQQIFNITKTRFGI